MSFRGSVCALVLSMGATAVLAGDVAVPSVDEVVKKHVEALGGRKALDAVKTMRMSGKMVMGGGMEAPMAVEFARPNKVRMEFTFQGMTGVRAYDGETGWAIMPFMGKTDPEKLPPDEIKDMADQADFEGPLVDHEKKGHKLEVEGADDFEGSPAFKVKVTRKDGEIEYYMLDQEHFLTLGTKGSRTIQGTPIDFEVTYGEYKEAGGLMLPHSFSQKTSLGMGGNTMVFEKIEINPEIDPSRFAMPEQKADATEAGK